MTTVQHSGNPGELDHDEERSHCDICSQPINGPDICATDVDLGICHAACLEGAEIVNLDSGEPMPADTPVFTYRYDSLPTAKPSGTTTDCICVTIGNGSEGCGLCNETGVRTAAVSAPYGWIASCVDGETHWNREKSPIWTEGGDEPEPATLEQLMLFAQLAEEAASGPRKRRSSLAFINGCSTVSAGRSLPTGWSAATGFWRRSWNCFSRADMTQPASLLCGTMSGGVRLASRLKRSAASWSRSRPIAWLTTST